MFIWINFFFWEFFSPNHMNICWHFMFCSLCKWDNVYCIGKYFKGYRNMLLLLFIFCYQTTYSVYCKFLVFKNNSSFQNVINIIIILKCLDKKSNRIFWKTNFPQLVKYFFFFNFWWIFINFETCCYRNFLIVHEHDLVIGNEVRLSSLWNFLSY